MSDRHPTKAQEDADPNTPPAKPAVREVGKPDQLPGLYRCGHLAFGVVVEQYALLLCAAQLPEAQKQQQWQQCQHRKGGRDTGAKVSHST